MKELFQDALRASADINQSTAGFDSPEFLATVQNVVTLFQECQKAVTKLSLYSDNEEIDDLTTASLEYLMIDYHLATVLERVPKSLKVFPREKVLQTVDQTIATYLSFLRKLYNYKILEKSAAMRYQELVDGQPARDVSNRPSLTQQLASSAKSREEKIRRYKLEKSLEQQIEALSKSQDEDSMRQATLLSLRLHSFKALDALSSLVYEKSMLSQISEDPNSNFAGDRDERERKRWNQEHNPRLEQSTATQPLLSSKGKVNRPFMLVNSRDQLQKSVFGTGQHLPTMTVEEYIDEEIKRGGIIQGGGKQSELQESSDEDDDEKADAKTYKAREWDKFTEQNPRGSGNTMNRG